VVNDDDEDDEDDDVLISADCYGRRPKVAVPRGHWLPWCNLFDHYLIMRIVIQTVGAFTQSMAVRGFG